MCQVKSELGRTGTKMAKLSQYKISNIILNIAFAFLAITAISYRAYAQFSAQEVAISNDASCAIATGGIVLCWGYYRSESPTYLRYDPEHPAVLANLPPIIRLAAGKSHFCAISYNRDVYCWGENRYGQLGNRSTEDSHVPIKVAGVSNVDAIYAGWNYTCAREGDGHFKCWGSLVNSFGVQVIKHPQPTLVEQLTGATAVAPGPDQLCMVNSVGNLECTNGETPKYSHGPSLNDLTNIALGFRFGCALKKTGIVACWGDNDYGQANPKAIGRFMFGAIDIEGIENATKLAVGAKNVCVMLADSRVKCWGNNNFYGTTVENGWNWDVVEVPGLNNPKTLAMGLRTCVIEINNGLKCWGNNTITVPVLSGAPQFTIGQTHACKLNADQSIRCWGNNAFYQLGSLDKQSTNVEIPRNSQFSAIGITAGPGITCVLADTGSVWCWGLGKSHTPIMVSGINDAIDIRVGLGQLCALLRSGKVWCWGNNYFGTNAPENEVVSGEVPDIENAVAITVGAFHSCVLLADHSAKCWGLNAQGQLGNGERTSYSRPSLVKGLTDASMIIAGSSHTCANTRTGLWCWGDNEFGQLRFNLEKNYPSPVLVDHRSNAHISVGDGFTCVSQIGTYIDCFGRNNYGQLGAKNSLFPNSNVIPVAPLYEYGQVPNPRFWSPMYYMASNSANSCGLLLNQSILCWGHESPLLGQVPFILKVPGVSNAKSIAAGEYHACAEVNDNRILCWGDKRFGQLYQHQLGTLKIHHPVAGSWHTCALTTTAKVYCWGANDAAQLGGGSQVTSSVGGSLVFGLEGAISLAAGWRHTCALRTLGSVHCWGDNSYGQLGDGGNGNRSTPITVAISDVKKVAANGRHSCALTSDNIVKCWGNNDYGQIGDGSLVSRSSPSAVVALSRATDIAAGHFHTCALVSFGRVKCWGMNDRGQLGDGTTTNRSTPVDVIGLSGVVALAAGALHTCALVTTGKVYCWGDNDALQLGLHAYKFQLPLLWQSSSPQEVKGLAEVQTLAAGSRHTCAIRLGGSVQCWGDNSFSQLGEEPMKFVEGFGPSFEITSNQNGTVSSFSLQAKLLPNIYDIGKFQKVFVYLKKSELNQDSWFTFDGTSWFSILSAPGKSFYSGFLQGSIEISIFNEIDSSLLCGSEIYVGYGSNELDMVKQNRYRKIHVLCE